MVDQHECRSTYPNDNDYASSQDGQSTDPSPDVQEHIEEHIEEQTLTPEEAIKLTRNVVEATRQEMRQTLRGTEEVGEALKLSLTIDLSRRGVNEIPEEMVEILKQDVERLTLSYNSISQIPSKFSECGNLTYLNLRGNCLEEVPRAICKLPKVQILDLSRNSLKKLPEEMKNMIALRVLSIMNNNLKELPFSLGFLESLRVLKLTGNPLSAALNNIIDGKDESPKPLSVPLPENEKESRVTNRIKGYLRHEANSLESGGDSRFVAVSFTSSEQTPEKGQRPLIFKRSSDSPSPLDTPRPLKRNPSLRFPVVPATSGSESATDVRSPGFHKPAIPARSHYRVASGQNSQLQSAALRRPGVSPLLIGNERNRSNSEGVLQATQNAKNKRMGIITRKTPELGTVDEARTNRNSHHYRGFSHASVLRDKHSNGVRLSASSGSSTPASPIDNERQFKQSLDYFPPKIFERTDKTTLNQAVIEGARSVQASLYHVHGKVQILLNLMTNTATKRASLERRYSNASACLKELDDLLCKLWDSAGTHPSLRRVRIATRECIAAYHLVGIMLWTSIPHLVRTRNQRIIRLLVPAIFGGISEAHTAFHGQRTKIRADAVFKAPPSSSAPPQLPPLPPNPPSAFRPNIPTKERPHTVRRLPSQATISTTRYAGLTKSSTNPYAAVPLYVNGRSRSNSRTNAYTNSAASSVANTPQSESFNITEAADKTDLDSSSPFDDPSFDAIYEKIYHFSTSSVQKGLTALPAVHATFSHCLQVAHSTLDNRDLIDLWDSIVKRSQYCRDMCIAAKRSLSSMQLDESLIRNSPEFWRLYLRYANSFISMIEVINEAKQLRLIDTEIQNALKPVYQCIKGAVTAIGASPWSCATNQDMSPVSQPVSASTWQGYPRINTREAANGRGYGNGHSNGHHRSRGGSGSSSYSSPYMNSGPATPMSAALGPAAVATMPSTPATPAASDRFRAGVADYMASSNHYYQQKELHRR
ncbi:RAM signaling network component [Trapelia coarctata]|nr:RAM signaling network component [Trapelia coarctata]